ncbi:hypothetical protein U1Q18_044185 [Sarracenia purpurea var. burkii]
MDSFVGGFSPSENQFGFDIESVSDYSDLQAVVDGIQFRDTFPDSDILDLPSNTADRMDSFVGGFSPSENQFGLDFESVSDYSDLQTFVNGIQFRDTFPDSDILDLPSISNTPVPVIQYTELSKRLAGDSGEESNLSDAVLKFINQALMEDDLEDEDYTIQDSSLHAAEKSFYEILNKKDPSSHNQRLPHVESPVNVPLESQPCRQFNGGMEKTKIIPLDGNDRTCYFEKNRSTVKGKSEKDGWDLPESLPRGRRKSLHSDESDLEEGRSKKHLPSYAEESVLHEMFDKVLSFGPTVKGSNGSGAMTRSGRLVSRKEAVNMRNLLMQCMESVVCNDHQRARELLRQIKKCSSPLGDGSQRLAHYFALSLEARLVGFGSPEFKWVSTLMSDADHLKAYKLYISACPFMEISYFFAHQAIMEVAETTTSLHIIHFGIMYGLQWPSLIQRLSTRPGGPPKLRITGIDLPQADLRPAGRVKETGCRLRSYCKRFHVPFEYNNIVKKWETVSVEDLKIEKNEVVVVNCLYQFMFLLDDTIIEHNSPRDVVLNMIRRINPDIFIHGIINGSFNSPFFMSRFREALFHYSALFDMFEANVPRENKERMVFERDILGNVFFNVLICEGSERVVRPETYKQWQVRTVRAGFRQLPLNHQTMKEIRAKVKSCYHKDFFVDEASQWMVAGWKGRAIIAFSCWKPA